MKPVLEAIVELGEYGHIFIEQFVPVFVLKVSCSDSVESN